MANTVERIFRFEKPVEGHVLGFIERYQPGGQIRLNSSTWMGNPPRTCGISAVKSHGERGLSTAIIEIVYRPKGYIHYVGDSRYDGWDLAPLDRAPDGTLLNGNGLPLPDGMPPVYLCFKVHHDTDFNAIDFGRFIGEFDSAQVAHLSREVAMKRLTEAANTAGTFRATSTPPFAVAHRHRRHTKLILSDQPSGEGRDGFGGQIININNKTPHLETVLLERLTTLMCDFLEGKAGIKSVSVGDEVFVDLSDSLVDCTLNEQGLDSWFDVLENYVPIGFMEELARRLTAKYLVEVSVVDGRDGGLWIKRA